MPNATRWQVDPAHSGIQFTIRHMVIAKVRGSFDRWTAALHLDEADLTRSSVEARIEAASIDTRNADRDNHLRGPDFFDVEKWPTISFRSRRIERAGAGYRVIGDLTIRDVTREVTLEVPEAGFGKDPFGNRRAMFHAEAKIRRQDFGLTWNAALETGGFLVGDEVEISIDVEAIAVATDKEKAA